MAKKKIASANDKCIFNINISEFFLTGKKAMLDDHQEEPSLIIEGNILYYSDNPYKKEKTMAIGVKSGKFLMINGDDDDILSLGHAEGARDDLIHYSNKEITTSFLCLKNAGLDLDKIKVVHITKDLSRSLGRASKGFKDFEKSIPQGATYKEHRHLDTYAINEKSYHRAGCMLIKHKNHHYICGMDEDSYFVSKLKMSCHPRNVDGAFNALKPKRVVEYEKKSSKVAKRQGEWFFIRVDMEATKMESWIPLPLQTKGANVHSVQYYEKSKGRHYCKGYVDHNEHTRVELGNVLHEAIQSMALDSWSVQGVD